MGRRIADTEPSLGAGVSGQAGALIEKGFLASSVKAMDGRAVVLMLPHVIRLNG